MQKNSSDIQHEEMFLAGGNMNGNPKFCCGDVLLIKSMVMGNGQEGLMRRVGDLEDYIQEQKGIFKTILWICGFIGLSNIIIFLRVVFR